MSALMADTKKAKRKSSLYSTTTTKITAIEKEYGKDIKAVITDLRLEGTSWQRMEPMFDMSKLQLRRVRRFYGISEKALDRDCYATSEPSTAVSTIEEQGSTIVQAPEGQYKIGIRNLIFRFSNGDWIRSTKTLSDIAGYIYQQRKHTSSFIKDYRQLLKQGISHDDAVLALL